MKNLCKSVVWSGVALAVLSTAANADIYIQNLQNVTMGSVSNSWLTSGSNTGGSLGSGDKKWALGGTIKVDYDAGTTSLSLASTPQTVGIYANQSDATSLSNAIGSLTISSFGLIDSSPVIFTNSLLGSMDIEVTAFASADAHLIARAFADSTGTVDFLDKDYGSTDTLFNNYGLGLGTASAGELGITLWGNEIVNDSSIDEEANWGVDWASHGPAMHQIPAPGAAFLAMFGLPMVGWIKRRYA